MSQVSVILENLAKGAVSEQFDAALEEVLLNIADPNTVVTKKREIHMIITFEASDKRDSATVSCQTKTKLVPPAPVGALIVMGKDSDGKIVAEEIVQNSLIPDPSKVRKIK